MQTNPYLLNEEGLSKIFPMPPKEIAESKATDFQYALDLLNNGGGGGEGELLVRESDYIENIVLRCEAAEHYLRLCWQYTSGPQLREAYDKWAALAGPENTETITL